MARRQKGQIEKLAEKTLRHMVQNINTKSEGGGMLLAGDPGIGKTTFVELFGALLGINTVIIEVPHITEEHLINIPFLVFNPSTNSTTTHSQQINYKMVLADSNLFTHLQNAQIMQDPEYLDYMQNRAPAAVAQLYQSMGGTEEKIPRNLAKVRQHYRSLLFLDEYFRQTSIRIRNILRNILNGQIGMHPIPKHAYILFASNMKDAGLEEIPSNTEFGMVNYNTPTAKDWMHWFKAKYEKDSHVQLNSSVIEKFSKVITNDNISHDDVDTEVRTSPRRWEQLLLYINSSIPPADEQSARALITNVKNNFVHHVTGEHSSLSKKVLKAVTELISETSSFKVDKNSTLPSHQWRDALSHHVEQHMKSGNNRKYIPVLSGLPGVGKTTHALRVADEHNLRFIHIDCSALNAEDIVGMPIPGERTEENIKIKFSVPKLFQEIMTKVKDANIRYVNELKAEHGDNAQKYIDQYKNQQWKYLIMFDEINRVDERTFNALRRIILEKNFGPSSGEGGGILRLPEGSIVMSAMNPEGVGTTEMTSHFRDVVDVIPAGASWEAVERYLRNKKYKSVNPETKDVAMDIILRFIKKFKSKDDTKYDMHTAPFNINVGTEMYLSPREYAAMHDTLVRELQSIADDLLDENISKEEAKDEVSETVADALEDSLSFPLHKHGIEGNEFIATLAEWVDTFAPKLVSGLISKQFETEDTWSNTLKEYLSGTKDVANMPEDGEINNRMNSTNAAQFTEEVAEALGREVLHPDNIQKNVLDETHAKVELEGEGESAQMKTNPGEKVSRLENFMSGFMYTLYILGFQHDRIMLVGKTLFKAVQTSLKAAQLDSDTRMDVTMAIAELRSNMHETASNLK